MKRGGVQEKGGGQDPLTPPSGHAYGCYYDIATIITLPVTLMCHYQHNNYLFKNLFCICVQE